MSNTINMLVDAPPTSIVLIAFSFQVFNPSHSVYFKQLLAPFSLQVRNLSQELFFDLLQKARSQSLI
jgi:hypothetical protein